MRAGIAYTGTARLRLIEWLRLPGDLVFIIFSSIPMTIAAIKGWLGVHAIARSIRMS
jgi:nitric oxide reductase subunit B